jgi:hypothetical protein
MNLTIDLNVYCKEVKVTSRNYSIVEAELENVEKSDILEHFELSDIVYHFEDDKILDHIGIDRVKEYFDLVEKIDESNN